MRSVLRSLWMVTMLAGLAFGQAPATSATGQAPAPAAKPVAAPAPGVELPPNAPVLRIPNVCPPAPKKAGVARPKCETVITRAEFERLIAAVRPSLPPAQRRNLAQSYAELLAIAQRAQRDGLDKDPQVQEQLRLARLQILATAYNRSVQKRLSNPAEAEIEKYYSENGAKFEQVTVDRLYLSKPQPKEGQAAPDDATAKALAESLRARSAAGEDMEKLQAEATKATSTDASVTPPPTKLGARRRGTLPPSHEHKVFETAPGQVTPVFEEPSGYFIYKVEAKGRLPLSEVRAEIAQAISSQKISDALESIRSSVTPEFAEAYFVAPEPPPPPPMPPSVSAPAAAVPKEPPKDGPAKPEDRKPSPPPPQEN